MVSAGNFLFSHRNALFPVAFLLAFLPGPKLFDEPIAATLAGAAVATVGELIRIVTIGLRYIVRGGRDRRVYAQDLITEGIYGHCRNPMYVGNLFILIGVGIAANSLSCLAVVVPLFVFVYASMVAAEESYLRTRFGADFDRYASEVPRWMPKWRGLLSTLGDAEFRWRRVLVKEYGTPFAWISGICVLGGWNLWRDGRFDTHGQAVQVLLSAIVAVTLVWGVVRYLKKRRVLVAD
jgi:protein-S-isoprenylcysteine O-methyltransferase Ste14